jgi:CRP/FNR family transcriptional regulator, cyclic AMP receptor protein
MGFSLFLDFLNFTIQQLLDWWYPTPTTSQEAGMLNSKIFDDVPFFTLLDEDERRVLAQQVSLRKFRKGDIIFKAGNPGGFAYIIQKGTVHVSIQDVNDETVVLDIADEGGLIGMSSLLAGEAHQTTAVAMENTTAIEIDRNDIAILLNKKPQAGLDMLTIVEKHLRTAHELMRTRVARNPNEQIDEQETLGQRWADAVAKFGGSWNFVILFGLILVTYVITNSELVHPWDPYPFILLNLFLSMIAALQAPIIMMSQNRQDTRDRVRSELDYRVNLKAELEIEELLQRVGEIEQMLGEERMENDAG